MAALSPVRIFLEIEGSIAALRTRRPSPDAYGALIVSILMPALQAFPKEAAIIGRLIPAYGEFEYIFAFCAGHVLGDLDRAIKLAFRLRSESHRFDTCDVLIRGPAIKASLESEYLDTHNAMAYCRKIRNQYAHCHWESHPRAGLFFVDLEPSAKKKGNTPISYDWRHVDEALLLKQEAYFIYCGQCLNFLQGALQVRMNGSAGSLPFPMPRGRSQPNEYNPLEKHIPPWQGLNPVQPPAPHSQVSAKRGHSPSMAQNARKLSAAQKRKAALGRRAKAGKAHS